VVHRDLEAVRTVVVDRDLEPRVLERADRASSGAPSTGGIAVTGASTRSHSR
jgi:hypothetical protein